ncbi:MAG: hypothetical protein R3C24_13655 [Cyanobacteriota/Melainabacteria group bacterium]
MEIASNASIGLIDRADSTGAHQLQLWIESSGHGYRYLIRSAYMPRGRLSRSCVLDSGPVIETIKRCVGRVESASLRLAHLSVRIRTRARIWIPEFRRMTCGFQPSHTRGVNMFLFNLIVLKGPLILGIAILEKVRIAFVFLAYSTVCHSSE